MAGDRPCPAAIAASAVWPSGVRRRPRAPLADPEPAKGTEPVGRFFFFDPATYVGESITATAYVSEVIEPVAFRIAGERSLPKRDCDGVRSVPSLTRVAAERRPSKESPS